MGTTMVAFDLLRDALSAIFGLSELKLQHNYGRVQAKSVQMYDDTQVDMSNWRETQDFRRLFYGRFSFYDPNVDKIKEVEQETDIQEKEQKESQRQTNPSTEWKGQSQKSSK
ncbi:hypothetical protein Tco_0316492 [Tanacetum coccineum]